VPTPPDALSISYVLIHGLRSIHVHPFRRGGVGTPLPVSMESAKCSWQHVRPYDQLPLQRACLCAVHLFSPSAYEIRHHSLTRAAGSSAQYCDEHVCLSASISPELRIQSSPSFVLATYGLSVLLWRRCDMLCTSGFILDVSLAHRLLARNGRILEITRQWAAGHWYHSQWRIQEGIGGVKTPMTWVTINLSPCHWLISQLNRSIFTKFINFKSKN